MQPKTEQAIDQALSRHLRAAGWNNARDLVLAAAAQLPGRAVAYVEGWKVTEGRAIPHAWVELDYQVIVELGDATPAIYVAARSVPAAGVVAQGDQQASDTPLWRSMQGQAQRWAALWAQSPELLADTLQLFGCAAPAGLVAEVR